MSTPESSSNHEENHTEQKKPSFLQIMLSTFAAAFGVQTNKNRERDFQEGNIYTYIAAGLIFTVIFVFAVVMLVKTILANAGM